MFSVKTPNTINKSIELQRSKYRYNRRRRYIQRPNTNYCCCCFYYSCCSSHCFYYEAINPFNIIIFKSKEQLKFEGGGGDPKRNRKITANRLRPPPPLPSSSSSPPNCKAVSDPSTKIIAIPNIDRTKILRLFIIGLLVISLSSFLLIFALFYRQFVTKLFSLNHLSVLLSLTVFLLQLFASSLLLLIIGFIVKVFNMSANKLNYPVPLVEWYVKPDPGD